MAAYALVVLLTGCVAVGFGITGIVLLVAGARARDPYPVWVRADDPRDAVMMTERYGGRGLLIAGGVFLAIGVVSALVAFAFVVALPLFFS